MKHPIERWLKKTDATRADLADRLSITDDYLRKLLLGEGTPSLALARQIYAITGIDLVQEGPRRGA